MSSEQRKKFREAVGTGGGKRPLLHVDDSLHINTTFRGGGALATSPTVFNESAL